MQSLLVNVWRRHLTIKSSATSTHFKWRPICGTVKVNTAGQKNKAPTSSVESTQVARTQQREKTTRPLYYSSMAGRVWMCGCFKGIRSQQSIKPPLIQPAFHGHLSGGEIRWPLQTPWAEQTSLETACSNDSPLTDLFSSLWAQEKGIRGTSEMQPDGCGQCSEVSSFHFRLRYSNTH